jgi:signal transduction histidine kinase
MTVELMDCSMPAAPGDAVEFITNILQASTEYSIIGKNLDGDIVLRNEGAHRLRDTGIGIKNEDTRRSFTEFEQLDAGTARRFEGTGLGLALTKKIVELQGGQISVESEPFKGSVFSVVLAIAKETTP